MVTTKLGNRPYSLLKYLESNLQIWTKTPYLYETKFSTDFISTRRLHCR